METRVAVALILCGVLRVCGQDVVGSNWLQALPDKTPLGSLHLPGTHNSAALHEPLLGTAQCQSLTVTEQLRAGVRFLDVRCRHLENSFHLYHGPVAQQQSFGELQATLQEFLRENPSETVIVSIQQTSRAKGNTRSFVQTAKEYFSLSGGLWRLDAEVPILSEARGKLILLRRFPTPEPLGIDGTDWGHGNLHRGRVLLIQDRFAHTDAANKYPLMQALWQERPKHHQLLALNFGSGYTKNQIGLPQIRKVSRRVNRALSLRLEVAPAPPPTILILDFITPELSEKIYRLNFAS